MDVQSLVEKSPPLVLAIGLHIKKIHSFAQKIIIVVTDCPEIFDQPHVEIGEIMAEEDMPLHVCFDVSNLDGSKKFKMVFQFCAPLKTVQRLRRLRCIISSNWTFGEKYV